MFIKGDAGQGVSAAFVQHILALDKPLFYKFIRIFRCLPGLASSAQKYAPFFRLRRHEICRNFDVHDVRAIRVRSKVVHEQVVRVVHEEMQGINHISVVIKQRYFDSLVDGLHDFLFDFLLV